MKLTVEQANKVYDLLVSIGGAYEPDRESFIYHHCESKHICEEWRFQGKLGFGGKYRSESNMVDCYHEDINDETNKVINELNAELSKIESIENQLSYSIKSLKHCLDRARNMTVKEFEELFEIAKAKRQSYNDFNTELGIPDEDR